MKPRPIVVEGDIAIVPLTRGLAAVIDAADAPLVEGANWYAIQDHDTFYAASMRRADDGRRYRVALHRIIVGAGPGTEVDHWDLDGLNNRRSNLRLATRGENCCNRKLQRNNTSGLKGVTYRYGKWRAKIGVKSAKIYLGSFSTREEAYSAYCAAAAKYHGEFARLA